MIALVNRQSSPRTTGSPACEPRTTAEKPWYGVKAGRNARYPRRVEPRCHGCEPRSSGKKRGEAVVRGSPCRTRYSSPRFRLSGRNAEIQRYPQLVTEPPGGPGLVILGGLSQSFGATHDIHEFLGDCRLPGLVVVNVNFLISSPAFRVAPSMAVTRAPCPAADDSSRIRCFLNGVGLPSNGLKARHACYSNVFIEAGSSG